jgi:hypothetical protein
MTAGKKAEAFDFLYAGYEAEMGRENRADLGSRCACDGLASPARNLRHPARFCPQTGSVRGVREGERSGH